MTTGVRSPEHAIDISDARCLDPEVVGGKAASLARARRIGLPVPDAMVLTTGFAAGIDGGGSLSGDPGIDAVIDRFGETPLAVRSSSISEDSEDSSLAGRFETVLDVVGRAALVDAVGQVLDSRARAAEGSGLAADDPIAVLIQPYLKARQGGVLFGVDPVTGRSDRLVLVAGPDPAQIVSGQASGVRNDLSPDGKRADSGADETLPEKLRKALADLASRTEAEFGRPQDLEWLLDEAGDLQLLQSRPVTTLVRGVPEGPLYGPGPVAETFPDPLSQLERDLWVPPLRQALREAVVLAGTARSSEVENRLMAVAPEGRVAIDLEITGEIGSDSFWRRLHPGVMMRRLGSAWRIGRLRAALPGLAATIIERTDQELRGVTPLETLTDRQLAALLARSQQVLVSLHAHEILMGLLVGPDVPPVTGASVAMRIVHDCRLDGFDDAGIIATHPIVLSLTAPRIEETTTLPATAVKLPTPADRSGESAVAGMRREALRVRVRWLHSLTAAAAWEAGRRLTQRGEVAAPEQVRDIALADLEALLGGQTAAGAAEPADTGVSVPSGTFQFSDRGLPISVRLPDGTDRSVGAGGGIGRGIVTHDPVDPAPGSVLVVENLRPELAPILPRLTALVAETGSPLAHLAILAREAAVATAVQVPDALARFAEGTPVEVDGVTGQVTVLEDDSRELPQ